MLTVLEVIKRSAEFLAGKGIESPRLQAELLAGHALGLKRMQLYIQFERPLKDAELAVIRDYVRRRGQREPTQYITGEAEFFGLKLKVDRRVLIPRPETELLVDSAIKLVAGAPARALDLGTGSGAIALALSTAWPSTLVTAVDESPAALELARENSAAAGLEERVEFLQSDWFGGLPAGMRFGLIVGNPPYLTEEEVAQTASEVREHEPVGALRSENEGRADLDVILAAAPNFLAEGGLLALETGIGQHERLLEAATAAGFARSESRKDLTGRDRFIFAWNG
jgi:release factor glutamine methyltransferase